MWTVLVGALVLAGNGCATRRSFPEAAVGWHTPGYTTVFGRLEKLAGPTADAPPVWTIRFGSQQEQYAGTFALTPPEKMVGYSGDERVEVKGHLFDQATTDAYNGRWYVVDSIQMWREYH